VSRLSTRRLIDASATLNAADRALLNIWVNRGLDDAALAHLTGINQETIADRRTRIVESLSVELGLPPEDVHSALTEISAAPEVHPADGAGARAAPADALVANGTAPPVELADAPPGPNGAAPPELVTPSADGPAPPARDPDTGSSSRRRRWWWTALALVVIVVVAVVLVVSLGSSGSPHHRGSAPKPAAHASTQTVAPTSSSISTSTSTSTGTSPTPRRPTSEPLVALPDGPVHATGSVRVTGTRPHLRLYVSVSNVPPASHGHYEVWLYDSLVYSKPLGRLRTGVTHLSLPLPGNASRFHWIDISFQPVGAVYHSGESLLRSANPLFAKAAAAGP
jgi:hypothetical protein